MTTVQGSAVGESDLPLVHRAFELQAQAAPCQTAIVNAAGGQVQYGELSERSSLLARRLLALGVRPDDCVAVYMDRSVELIVSMLAILEAGGCYVPIDVTYPRERAAAMLRNAQPRVLIADAPIPEGLSSPGLIVIQPRGDGPERAASAEGGAGPEHLAYVIYTSGSTGSPKGVAMTHRGLSRLIEWQIDDGPKGLTTLQFTPICFDVTFQEVFSTLCSGGTLVLVSDAVRRDPEQFLETIERQSIARLFLPYTALQRLANTAVRTGRVPRTLRHVITAGEPLVLTDAIARFFTALPSCRLDNQYGPTETHLVTRHTLDRDRSRWPSLPPIGAAPRGVHLYCLDAKLRPVPNGEDGELYVGGEGLARGYLNDPQLTDDRFVPDPFGSTPGARMYRTGDRGRIGIDGTAEFLGRADDQIKVRGFRVEPGEIEWTLAGHPSVREAAVGLRQIAEGVSALVGYIVMDGRTVSASELASYVRERLPEFMVPSRFVFLDSLPQTPTGKVDRRRLASEVELPPLAPLQPADGPSFTATVRGSGRVLEARRVRLDDDFFDVGGDSLLAPGSSASSASPWGSRSVVHAARGQHRSWNCGEPGSALAECACG